MSKGDDVLSSGLCFRLALHFRGQFSSLNRCALSPRWEFRGSIANPIPETERGSAHVSCPAIESCPVHGVSKRSAKEIARRIEHGGEGVQKSFFLLR